MPLVNKHMARDEPKEPGTAKAKKSKKSPSAAADQPLVQLAKLAWGSAGEVERLADVAGRIVSSMGALTPALSDWPAYADLLTGETLDDDDVRHLQCVLLHLMAASATQLNEAVALAADGDAAADAHTPRKKAKRAPTRKELEAQDEGTIALSTELGRSLAPLLEKFGAQSDALLPLLTLVRQMRLQSAASTLKGSGFGELLGQLEACFLKHNDIGAMRACGSAWAELLTQGGAPALQEQARVRFKKLINKLVASLKPLDAHAKKAKGGGAFDFDGPSVAVRRIAHLVAAYPHSHSSLTALDSLIERLLPLLHTRQGAEPGLSACVTALLQLKTTVLTAQVAEERAAAAEEGGGAAVELDESTSGLRDELLPLLCSALEAPVSAVAKVAAGALSLLLGTVLPRAEAAADATLQEASGALLKWFGTALDAAADGAWEDDDETEDEQRTASAADPPGPRWLRDVVSCALLHGLPTATVLCSLLERLADLPPDFKVFAKQLWTQHLTVAHPAQRLAKLEEEVLHEAFETNGGANSECLEAVARQLGQLHVAVAASSRGKGRASELTHLMLDAMLETSLDDDGNGETAFVEAGLAPLLVACSPEQAVQLSDKFGERLENCPGFGRKLGAAIKPDESRRKSVAREAKPPRESFSVARKRRLEKRRLSVEDEDDEAADDDDDEEAVEPAAHEEVMVEEEEAEEEEEGVFEEKAGAQIFVDVLCLIRICARAARAFTHGCFTN